jgi:alanine racemase
VRRGHGFPNPHFWIAPADGWGAEVALGYGSGYPRCLAGKARVLLGGRRRPLVGVVSRDTCYVFGSTHRPEPSEEVVFWGKQGRSALYLFELAGLMEALPYELPTWLSASVPRRFLAGSKASKPAASVLNLL